MGRVSSVIEKHRSELNLERLGDSVGMQRSVVLDMCNDKPLSDLVLSSNLAKRSMSSVNLKRHSSFLDS